MRGRRSAASTSRSARCNGPNAGSPVATADSRRRRPSGRNAGGEDKRRDPSFWKNLPRDFALGTKYIVQQRLGKPGASGVAYKVFDTMRNVDRVIKLILRDEEGTKERARREGQVLHRLQERAGGHPNVVQMLDVDVLPQPYPYPFLVFEFVTGEDLGEVIKGRTLAPSDVLRIGLDVAEGLKYLHSLDVWHCDIKPGNLLWTEGGVKILDFGIAKTPESTQGHTASTPRYTPPDLDQVPASAAGYVDRDLYALGVTLYEALTGAYPWEGASTPPPAMAAEDPRERYTLPGVPVEAGRDDPQGDLTRARWPVHQRRGVACRVEGRRGASEAARAGEAGCRPAAQRWRRHRCRPQPVRLLPADPLQPEPS